MLKKALAWVIAVTVVFSFNLLIPVTARAESGTYFINDDFESDIPGKLPAGWVQKYSGEGASVVDNVYKLGNHSFKLDGKASWSATYYKVIDTFPNEVTVEAYMRPASAGESGSISLFSDKGTWGTYLARVVFRNEQICYSESGHDDNNLVNLQSYTVDTWYHIKIVHDLNARTYDVYVDGVNKASNVAMYSNYDPDSLVLSSGNGSGSNIMYYDDVKVYSGDEAPLLSPNATLSDLTVDGTTVEGFDPEVLNYDVELPAGTTEVPTVTATVYDTGKATAVVTPAESLPGTTTVLVTAEDGSTTKTYNINFTATEGDTIAPTPTAGDVTRSSATEATVKFTPDEAGQYYYAVVESGASEPVIDTSGTGADCDATEQTITLNGLTAGAKEIYIKVKDAAGNVSNALKMEIPLSAAEKVAADKAALEIIFAPGDSAGAVTQDLIFATTGANGSTITWQSGNPAVISVTGEVTRPVYAGGDANVTVTATLRKNEATDTKTFNLTVTKLPPSGNANLAALTATGISLTPEFSSATDSYSAGVEHGKNSTTITATPADNTATVTINGTPGSSRTVDLSVGSNAVTIEVTAQDGITQKTYTLTINRTAIHTITFNKNNNDPGSTEADPATKEVTGGSSIDSLPTPPTRTGYIFEGWRTGNGIPDDGTGIDGGDGWGTEFTENTIVTEDLTVYAKWLPRPGISLGETSGTLTAGMAGSVNIPVTTENMADGEELTVAASGNPAGVTVTATTVAGNACTITVAITDTVTAGDLVITADYPEAEQATKTVTVAEGDTTAPTLTAGEVARSSATEATVKFTPDEAGQYYYAVVESGASEPVIDTSGTGADCDATEQTITLTDLTAGAKEIYIKVKDAAGNVSNALKMEIPKVTKLPPSGNANLAELTAAGISLTPDFSSDTENYSAGVEHGTNSTTITATPADNTASVSINGTPGSSRAIDLNVGSNTVTIEVTARDGITQKTYTLNITRSGAGSSGGGGGGGKSVTNEVSKFVSANNGGEISMEGVTVNVPGGSISGDGRFSIKKLSAREQNSVISSGMRLKLCGHVYEIDTTGDRDFGDNAITIKIAYEPEDIGEGDQPVIHYYDEESGEWIAVETTTEYDEETGRYYAVITVNHLTKFAVFEMETEAIAARTIKLTIGSASAMVESKPYSMDALPYLDEQAGRTLVPVRFVSEALGAGVEWDPVDHTVNVEDNGKRIILKLDSRNVLVDGLEQSIDCVPTVLPPGRTFVPLRFISETLDAQVDYEADTGQITITR